MVVASQRSGLQLVERHGGHPVHLTVEVHVVGGVVVVDRIEDDLVKLHRVGIPVLLVAYDPDVGLGHPFLQGERSVADKVLGKGPLVAILLDGVHRHDRERVVGQRADRVRKRSDQLDLEGLVVDRAHAEGFWSGFTGVELGRSLQEHRGEPCVRGSGRGIELADPRVHEGLGGDGHAVAPHRVAQGEGVGGAVVADGPALRQSGDTFGGLGIVDDQTFEDGLVEAVLGNSLDHLGIEALGLGTVDQSEDHGRFFRWSFNNRWCRSLLYRGSRGLSCRSRSWSRRGGSWCCRCLNLGGLFFLSTGNK